MQENNIIPEIPTENRGNILVVDDTRANLRLLVGILSRQGYKVRPASSGPLALTAAQTEPPDIVLLDVMMPEMDGFEVCQQLKSNTVTQDIPIIFISALDEVEDKVKALSIGGVDYITKPFQAQEVLARVNTHLTIRYLQQQLETKNELLQAKNNELEAALVKVKLLSGLLPICANCKKIRDDQGYWQKIEIYIRNHSEAEFTHGICPDCIQILYPELYTDGEFETD